MWDLEDDTDEADRESRLSFAEGLVRLGDGWPGSLGLADAS